MPRCKKGSIAMPNAAGDARRRKLMRPMARPEHWAMTPHAKGGSAPDGVAKSAGLLTPPTNQHHHHIIPSCV